MVPPFAQARDSSAALNASLNVCVGRDLPERAPLRRPSQNRKDTPAYGGSSRLIERSRTRFRDELDGDRGLVASNSVTSCSSA